MNLEQAIFVYAGGPGSGCHGPNCGRPEGTGTHEGTGTRALMKKFLDEHPSVALHHPSTLQRVQSPPAKGSALERHEQQEREAGEFRNFTGPLRDESPVVSVHVPAHGVIPVSSPARRVAHAPDVVQQPSKGQMELFNRPLKYANATPIERSLLTKDVDSTDNLGGGVSETMKVTFKDGSLAVFKPNDGDGGHRMNIVPGNAAVREVGAWEVAKVVGMDDLVTPTVFRNLDGRDGALMQWNEGDVAHEVEDRGGEMFDGNKDAARTAVFDWVIGNEDRHAGNWMLNNGKLRLIDHGLAFPDKGPYSEANGRMIEYADYKHFPPPMKLAKPYVDGAVKIREVLQKIGMPERAIKGVEERIQLLADADEWEYLRPQY